MLLLPFDICIITTSPGSRSEEWQAADSSASVAAPGAPAVATPKPFAFSSASATNL